MNDFGLVTDPDEMAQMVEHKKSAELVLPFSGEVINLADWRMCASALKEIRDYESVGREVKGILTRAIAEAAAREGKRTLELANGAKVHISSSSETEYDAEAIQQGLADAGMPQERISEIVEETVVLKVRAVEAKRAANANAAYATVIDEHSREVFKPVTVSIRRP